MILTHDEVSGQETVPTWVSVDEASIQTPKEVWEEVKEKGWRVDYWRIPIAPDRPIEVSSLPLEIDVTSRVGQLPRCVCQGHQQGGSFDHFFGVQLRHGRCPKYATCSSS